ncbi:hypothetical protein ACEPPN_013198 [Leptodophora sp. 'Broadleaf-Isolate-01']
MKECPLYANHLSTGWRREKYKFISARNGRNLKEDGFMRKIKELVNKEEEEEEECKVVEEQAKEDRVAEEQDKTKEEEEM